MGSQIQKEREKVKFTHVTEFKAEKQSNTFKCRYSSLGAQTGCPKSFLVHYTLSCIHSGK